MTDATDRHLAAQYEAYPYPERIASDERKRLIVGSPSHLAEIDHWVFAAARPASQPLRALVAGGGTGDGTIMLAAQLARDGRAGHVTYLDRSEAALRIARARAEVRARERGRARAGRAARRTDERHRSSWPGGDGNALFFGRARARRAQGSSGGRRAAGRGLHGHRR
jgi:SAM-dependent methyltransferase